MINVQTLLCGVALGEKKCRTIQLGGAGKASKERGSEWEFERCTDVGRKQVVSGKSTGYRLEDLGS